MTRMLRRDGDRRVSQIELFYDLVYVFAVTQLSHLLVEHRSVDGALQTAVLLAMVWQVWVYTAWLTNYLDPNRQPVRLMLVLLMLASLVFAAALPYGFETRGTLIAVGYVVIQVGRTLFGVWATRGTSLRLVFLRLLPWTVLAAVPILLGAAVHGHAREALWAAGVAIELVGASVGFAVPFLGHTRTTEWTIDGGHFAERCQAFVLIALGESMVVTGATTSGLIGPGEHASVAQWTTLVFAFAGAVGLWWVYFDMAAEDSARVIASSDDPGRLGRSAFHWVHPIIVAGIIVSAAADEVVLDEPAARGVLATSWLVLGGVALFLAGHAIFKAIIWRIVSWPRVIAVLVLLALLAVAPHVSALTLGIMTLAVVAAVIVADRLQHPALLDADAAS